MPTPRSSLRAVFCTAGLWIMCLGISPGAHADGYCMYQQLSPWTKQWYAFCKMPATEKSCDKWAMTRGISATKFADGACPAGGAVGPCLLGGESRYFYKVSAKDAATGCAQMEGRWQPDEKSGS